MPTRKLIVEIIGDASSLDKSFKQAQRSTNGFANEMERAARGGVVATVGFRGLGRSVAFASGAFLGGAGLLAVTKQSVEAASNLNEQISKTNVVFGDSAESIKEWATTSATSMGLAQDQALAVASSFGALFKPLKIVGDQAAQQSEQLTQLGADLASFYNTDVQDALDAIRSGLVGESEPLRRYGILLSETRVQQEALNQTGKKAASQLTDQEKVLARISLIFKDSGQAQGDFARTSGGLANQTRILKANLRELETEIGQGLVPGLTDAARAANFLVKQFERIPGHSVSGLDVMRELGKHAGDIARHAPVIGSLFKLIAGTAPDPGWTPFLQSVESLIQQGNLAGKLRSVEQGITSLSAGNLVPPTVKGKVFVGRPLSPREQLLLALSGNPDDTRALQGLIGLDQEALAFALQQIKEGHGNTKAFFDAATRLKGEISDFNARLEGIAQAAALKAEEAARKAAEAAKKAREAQKKYMEHLRSLFKDAAATISLSPTSVAAVVRQNIRTIEDRNKKLAQSLQVGRGRVTQAQRDAAVFRRLGLTATGAALAPTRKELKAGLVDIEKNLKGTILDTDKNRNLISRIREVLDDQFTKLSKTAREKIKELEDSLKTDKQVVTTTPFHALDVSKITAGLDRATALRLQSRLAGAHLLTGGSGPRSGRPLTIVNEIPVSLDGREITRSVTKHQTHADQRKPTQTRGRQTR